MKIKKNRGINALKARYGWICISPWILGLTLFFILPIVQSVIYSFSDVSLQAGGMKSDFIGFENFKYIFLKIRNHQKHLLYLPPPQATLR